MPFSHDDVERILKLLEASHFDELQLEVDGLKLDLRRNSPKSVTPEQVKPQTPSAQATPQVTAAASSAVASKSAGPAPQPVSLDGVHEIKSPMLGTFYRSPKPGADPFVKVGSRLEPETVIGIVEVMKLMNSVAAGVHGEVIEIVAPDAQLVEFGQVLIRVKPF